MSLGVLFVCTGNICRSPIAERLLQASLVKAGIDGIVPSSAGTRAVVGYAMDRSAAYVLSELGGDPDGHVARQLSPEIVSGTDLILTATTAHRSDVIRADPMAMRRTFTIREFVRLGAGLAKPAPGLSGGSGFAERVADVAAQRGQQDPAGPGEDDIGDPYGAPLPVMQECGRQLSAVVEQIVRVFGL